MKKTLFSLLLLAISPVLWAFSLSDLSQTLQKPQSVQGTFTQQRFLKSLNKPMTTRGQFALLPKKGLLWHMQKPFETRLRVRADGIMQFNGKTWQPERGSKAGQSQQIQLFLDLLGGDTQGLAKQFDLRLTGSAQKWTLNLQPKTVLMKQIFQNIVISGDEVVRKIELVEKQGDKTVMQFDNVKRNAALDAFAQTALK
ncbi:MAG: outer membrane lipoprotein carrier protein LolA [Neisseria sp.]|nr:outer membrane lipoprotein carrier protein LolA [Neisseria sp.]